MAEKTFKADEVDYIVGNGEASVMIDLETGSALQEDRMDAYAEEANKMLEEG